MRYTVINSKREGKDEKYQHTWMKYKTLQEAKEEELKHQENDDFSSILVPYDEYREVVIRLDNLKSVLDQIGAMASGSKVLNYIDKDVLDDIYRRR